MWKKQKMLLFPIGDLMNTRVLQLLVDNTSGVLSRISGLFSRRGYNIDSISAGVTADPRFTRITIVTSGDDDILEQIEKQLNKKLDVIKIKTFDENQSVSRELMLIKVKYTKTNRRDVMEVAEAMNASIVDMSQTQMMLQICDTPERTAMLIKLLSAVSIVEIARTGTLALPKCSDVD